MTPVPCVCNVFTCVVYHHMCHVVWSCQDLLGAFCSCRANVLAYLHAYHGVDLNKTSTKLNSATNRVIVHRPAPDATNG